MSRYKFKEDEVPYAILEEFGLNQEMIEDLPKFYTFPSKEAKEHILYENFVNVNREVDQMCKEITQFVKK